MEVEGEAKPIETTPEHPFFVRVHRARDSLPSDNDGEWRESDSLQVGDEALSASRKWQRVVSVERQARSETVYNFAVEDNHNYFVGNNGNLVHNSYWEEIGNLQRQHDLLKTADEMEALVEDIFINGIKEPIKIFEHNGIKFIVDGHHRLEAALQLGYKSVPVEKVSLPHQGYKTVADLEFWYPKHPLDW